MYCIVSKYLYISSKGSYIIRKICMSFDLTSRNKYLFFFFFFRLLEQQYNKRYLVGHESNEFYSNDTRRIIASVVSF